ncbi:MAG: hypothetical protein EBZ61_09075 [Micrococcales bacterium]|nr:hypothetical protein [Micrococcales bacterium]
MATQENRGGANGGSQYNPNKISPMGGNGQSGKKAEKAMRLRPSGGSYGATKALNEQIQQGGNVASTATAAAGGPRPLRISANDLGPITGITDPSLREAEDITTGSLANPVEALTLPGGGAGDTKFKNNIQAYYPILAYISGRSDTSEDTRQILNTLMRAI